MVDGRTRDLLRGATRLGAEDADHQSVARDRRPDPCEERIDRRSHWACGGQDRRAEMVWRYGCDLLDRSRRISGGFRLAVQGAASCGRPDAVAPDRAARAEC